MDVRRESEAPHEEPHGGGAEVRARTRRHTHLTRLRASCSRRDQGRTIQESGGTQSYGLTLLSCEMDVRVGGQYRLGFATKIRRWSLRHVPRSDTALAPRLDQRGR